jgi:hypothetical protein
MAIEPPPTQPGYEGGPPQDHKTAKANAKAAAAYAKAQRPWYKKKRYLFLMAVAVIVVIVIATSVGGGSDKTAGDKTTAPTAAQPSAGSGTSLDSDAGAENPVKEGSTFVLGDFKILPGWQIHNDGFGLGYEIKNLQVKNVTGDDHAFDATFKLHRGAHTIAANIDCITDEAQAGDVVETNCLPDGSGKPYDRVTVENTF